MIKMAKGKRKVADCRLYPSEKNCSLLIAGTEDEVMRVAVRHAIEEHGHKDSAQLRKEIKATLRDE
jgi:predicted small metal-binding protein